MPPFSRGDDREPPGGSQERIAAAGRILQGLEPLLYGYQLLPADCCLSDLPHANSSPHTRFVDFLIRPYRAADFDRLWEIDQLCFPRGIAYSQMELMGFIGRRNAITLVAELAPSPDQAAPHGAKPSGSPDAAGTTVGFAVAQPYRRTGRILTLDIVPEARRHGLASRLMSACEDRLRQRGCTEVYLETAVDNQPAIKLYNKLGYQMLRTLPAYYHAYGLDAFLMAKTL
jgi:ribosomal-protein-alanine N-acetyltransferase